MHCLCRDYPDYAQVAPDEDLYSSLWVNGCVVIVVIIVVIVFVTDV